MTETVKKRKALTKRPALVLEMESIVISEGTRRMHKQCVFDHTDNLTTLQRVRPFSSTTCSVFKIKGHLNRASQSFHSTVHS